LIDWLTINGKSISSSKEATHSYLKGIANFGFLTFHQNLSKSISERKGCAKMNIKGRERKRNEKESADLKIWTKVHGLSRTRWHRFSKTGGTGFCRQHKIYP
jgi:hypothetical protein